VTISLDPLPSPPRKGEGTQETARPGPAQRRDARRSREAILEAAEGLFAERGFEGTSLAAIGAAAGLSRGAPAYFFGSKDQLYRAVLARLFRASRQVLPTVEASVAVGDLMTAALGQFIDFLVARPAFLRILEWESLAGERRLQGLPEHLAALGGVVEALVAGMERGSVRSLEPGHLVVSLIALCMFPLGHPALTADLGLDAGADFVEQRKRQVVDLVLHGVLPR
jgi:TetR/AcrR family transcriptional regulator